MKVRSKIMLGYLLMSLLIGAIGWLFLLFTGDMKLDLEQTTEVVTGEAVYAAHLNSELHRLHILTVDLLNSRYHSLIEPEEVADALAEREKIGEQLGGVVEEFQRLLDQAERLCRKASDLAVQQNQQYREIERLALLQTIREGFEVYRLKLQEYRVLVRRDLEDADEMLREQLSPVYVRLTRQVEELRLNVETALIAEGKEISERLNTLERLLVVMILLLFAMALVFGSLLSKRIVVPLHRLVHAVQGMRLEKSPQLVEIKTGDEIQELGEAFNQMSGDLHSTWTDLLESREQAELANRTKTRLLANMGHEMRTPLNAIIGYSQLLKQEPGTAADQVSDFAERIYRASRALLDKINSILYLTQLEIGDVTISRARFSLAGLLTEVHQQHQTQARSRELHYTCEIAEDLPHTINSDRQKLSRMLRELVENAIIYTPLEGQVTLRGLMRDGQLQIQVQDSGPGISRELRETIFNPFQQADDATTRAHEGMGIGLAIARQLARLLEVRIEVESEPGKGSIFIVRMDLDAAEDD